MKRLIASLIAMLACTFFGSAATAPVTAVSTNGNQLVTLAINGNSYPQAQLVLPAVTAFAAGGATVPLVPNGAGVPAAGSRKALLQDWLLDSGLINPAVGASTVTITFSTPIVNGPGADVVFLAASLAARIGTPSRPPYPCSSRVHRLSQSDGRKISWSRDTVWVDKAQTTGFRGVREDVWNFHIGGYQVCEKWLKDRKGRTLTKDDLAHYQKIVIALSETIRLMREIDQVIEQHGGWPGAFPAAPRATGR